MSKSSNICAHCGKPSQSESNGSLTQWVLHCKCHLLDSRDVDFNTIQICTVCGRRIAAGRSGSFTQWIFRSDVCGCENPIPIEKSIKSLSQNEFEKSAVDLSRFVEIEVDKETFPAERFAPIEILGRSQGSTVYLAIDRLLGTRVAIKTIILNNTDDVVRFQKEVKALASLSHPGIIKVLDFSQTSGTPYMVMEYVSGVTLRQFLTQNSKMTVDDVVSIMKGLCHSLSYCHQKGIVHRDLKPENLLVCEIGNQVDIKLVDFGLVSTIDNTNQANTIAGTPSYMAPDVARGDNYDVRSEVYSLGCLMFELLTGTLPYVADTPLQLLKQHADSEVPSLSARRDGIDPQLEEIVSRCLAKDAAARYQSVDELNDTIKQYAREKQDESETSVTEQNPASVGLIPISREIEKQAPRPGSRTVSLVPALTLASAIVGVLVYFVYTQFNTSEDRQKAVEPEFLEQGLIFQNKRASDLVGKDGKRPIPPTGPKIDQAYLSRLASQSSSKTSAMVLDNFGGVTPGQLSSFFRAMKLIDVTFANEFCTPEYIRTAFSNRRLKIIRLKEPSVEDVKAIPRKLPDMRTVSMQKTVITADHVRALAPVSSMNHLQFRFSELGNGVLDETTRLPILHLNLIDCSFWLEDFANLEKKKDWLYLRLKACRVLEPGQNLSTSSGQNEEDSGSSIFDLIPDSEIRAFPVKLYPALSELYLRRIYIEGYQLTTSDILNFARIRGLRRLYLKLCNIEKGSVAAFRRANPGIAVQVMDCKIVSKSK